MALLPYIVQFVDRIAATPTVRLDLSATWVVQRESDLSPPPLQRAYAGSLLADGRPVTAAAYGNRTIQLELLLRDGVSEDQAAAAVQALAREVDRPGNFMRWQPGTTQPAFFRTLRAEFGRVYWDAVTKRCTVQIPAEPFAYGLRVDLAASTVYNDPATPGAALNANPYFETSAASWTALGGTFARSTLQFHQGAASGLLTPDGVTATTQLRSESVAATAGATYTLSVWMRCAVARNVTLKFRYNSVSSTSTTVALAATTWTLVTLSDIAPAGTTDIQLAVDMGSTPPVGHTLHVDEAQIGMVGAVGANGMFFDLAGSQLLGDVETPLFLSVAATDVISSGRRISAVGVRRRGTPSSTPHLLQAESMTPLTGTTLQPNDSLMSGTGSNFMRAASFTVNPCVTTTHPAAPSVDVRGTYRVFVRTRKGVAGDTIRLRLSANTGGTYTVLGDWATLPTDTTVRWIDLGLLQLPLGADPAVDGYSGASLGVVGVNFAVAGERTSGASYVDLDCVLLLPADDRLALIKWPEDAGPVSLIVDAAASQIYGVNAAGQVASTAPAELSGGLPLVSPGQDTRIFFALDVGATSLVGDDKTETTVITPYYWPRYLYVRGAV